MSDVTHPKTQGAQSEAGEPGSADSPEVSSLRYNVNVQSQLTNGAVKPENLLNVCKLTGLRLDVNPPHRFIVKYESNITSSRRLSVQ